MALGVCLLLLKKIPCHCASVVPLMASSLMLGSLGCEIKGLSSIGGFLRNIEYRATSDLHGCDAGSRPATVYAHGTIFRILFKVASRV